MTLSLPGVRPPVLRAESARAAERYLDFRHKFRNLYFFDLDWALLEPLLRDLPGVFHLVREDLEAFAGWLRGLSGAVRD
jgi:hypothetical protein